MFISVFITKGGDDFSAKIRRLSVGDLILNLKFKISVDFCGTEQSEMAAEDQISVLY